MLAPLSFTFDFLTWRESVVGMKGTESVQLDIRRTWDIKPKNPPILAGSVLNQSVDLARFGGGVNSETLGFVRWRMSDTTLFSKPCHLLFTEAYDRKAHVLVDEEVWTSTLGEIVRQREVRATDAGREISDAAFYPDRIEASRIDKDGKTTFATVNPAGGMEMVQARFKPMAGNRKEFLRYDGIAGTFRKVVIEKAGRFRGGWGGDSYSGPTYRYTVDGKEQTLMLTEQDEIVQVAFDPEVALVLSGPTKSRRKGGK